MNKNYFIVFISILFNFAITQLEYSLEDVNTTSPTYNLNVWYPEYSEFITLHYFSTQGWAGWTATFVQLHNFQNELRYTDGFTDIVVIAVGQTNISSFNENFCSDSDLPLVMDPYPELPLREMFNGGHKEVVIVDSDSNILGRITLNGNLNNTEKNYIRGIISENYPDEYISGDINNDQIVNVLDVIQTVNMVLGVIPQVNIADVNQDGLINVLDIINIVNIIINA